MSTAELLPGAAARANRGALRGLPFLRLGVIAIALGNTQQSARPGREEQLPRPTNQVHGRSPLTSSPADPPRTTSPTQTDEDHHVAKNFNPRIGTKPVCKQGKRIVRPEIAQARERRFLEVRRARPMTKPQTLSYPTRQPNNITVGQTLDRDTTTSSPCLPIAA